MTSIQTPIIQTKQSMDGMDAAPGQGTLFERTSIPPNYGRDKTSSNLTKSLPEQATSNIVVQSNVDNQIDEDLPRLIYRMPNTAFGIPMGLAGHAIMWKSMRTASFVVNTININTVDSINIICWYLACVVSLFIAILYAYKFYASFPLVMAEWLNEVRGHFFNAPNLIFIMLLIGTPNYMNVPNENLRILWALAFCYQIIMTHCIYKAWMFSKRRNFTEAKPQFLMSTVGWFLLATFGQLCEIRKQWGIGLPQMCFGAGFILYIDIVIFIFGKLHENRGMKGSPGMFLLIAPPSVGVVSLDLLNDGASDFSQSGEMLLGWVFVLLLLLFGLGPILWRSPSVLGEYWAYVFPLAAATTATIRYAAALQTEATVGLALIMIVIAVLSLLMVLGRMSFHIYRCFQGKAQYKDPLFRIEKYCTRQLCLPKRNNSNDEAIPGAFVSI